MADAQTSPADSTPAVPTTTPATTPRTPQDQLRILALAATLSGEELGAMLRREGVHAAELEAWRSAVVEALMGRAPAPVTSSAERKRILLLERELERKEKALDGAAPQRALVVAERHSSRP